MKRGFALHILVICSVTSVLFISSVNGNPLPEDVEWRGTGGGNPVPDGDDGPIYLKEEFIKAVVKDETADMTCIYTFKNDADADSVVNITLPFVKDPTKLKLFLDGEKNYFSWGYYEYEPLSKWIEGMIGRTGNLLQSIRFQITINGGEEFEVRVEYNTPISVYNSLNLGGDISYWYCYLVGTGREWGHPIEKARFEVRIPSRMYSRHISENWEKHRALTKIVFESEYENWVPNEDLIILEWKKIDPLPIPTEVKMGCCFSIIGIEILIIASIIFISKKRRKKLLLMKEE